MTGLLSCSKSLEQDGGLVSDMPLVFSPTADWPQMGNGDLSGSGTRSGNGTGTGAATKALVESAEDLKQYGISLFATATKGEDIYPVFNNDNLKFTGGSWNYDITKYWIPGASYSFAAFAPYATNSRDSKSISNGTVSSTGTETAPQITIANYISGKVSTGSPQFDARSEDLLFATHLRDNTSSSDYSAVPLQFNHLLSCITFNIRNATNEDIISVTDIKLTGLLYKGSITYGTSGLSVEKDDAIVGESENYFAGNNMTGTAGAPFLPKGMSEAQFKYLFDCDNLTVFPQTVWGCNIKIKFRVNYNSRSKDYTGNLSSIDNITSWDMGKKYRYNITISSDEIIFQVQEIPWIEHEIEL